MLLSSAIATEAVAARLRRAGIGGQLILPHSAEFDEARTLFYRWNDFRPAAIVRVASAQDVSRVIMLAQEHQWELAVRSGGHSIAGHSMTNGGVVLDLSGLRNIEIDPAQRSAWTEPGVTAGGYTDAAAERGLATGFGDTGSVGVGGLTLGGGIGFFVRKFGLTIDDLLAADVVTADGQLVRADPEQHPDLFWAIRGGGGNFGVVTKFKLRLHEVDRILGGILVLPLTAAAVRDIIAEADAAPEELSVIVNIVPAAMMPFLPPEFPGKFVIVVLLVCTGDLDVAQRTIAPIRAIGKPIADMVQPMRYKEIYGGDGPHPAAGSVRSMFIDAMNLNVAETIIHYLQECSAPTAVTQLRVLGGAMARVPRDATAFAHRHRRILVNVAALYERPGEAEVHDEWASRFAAALHQGEAGVYVNFLAEEGEARVREAYPGATWDRLSAIKVRYDPRNVFCRNQNIKPRSI
jgi:FAD/FMN-containing dehydrogenase